MYALRQPLNAYARIGIETGVLSATPLQLIVMLYDGALASIGQARASLHEGQPALKGEAISKAISIIDDGLRASLNTQSGGNIAAELDALYEYMTQRLIAANLRNDIRILDEVSNLLRGLKSAWDAVDEGTARPERREESQARINKSGQ